MEAIKDTIAQVIRNLAEKKSGTGKDDPETLLKKVLTKKELEHIKFKYLKNGVLYVSADSSSWLYAMNLKKEGLLQALTKESRLIKDIRFRLGEVQ
ncbi:MAG: DUF721 domain-containing protein [Candidatus Omnitrophica bacterium]|nr:DUF721 domain-containing protein [Candidatus Omnitrophota bacterium]